MSSRHIQVNLDMTDSMGPGKLVRHMQNPSYTYDEYLICNGVGLCISSVICKNPSYNGPSYPSSPVIVFCIEILKMFHVICIFSGISSINLPTIYVFMYFFSTKYGLIHNKKCNTGNST